MTQSKRESQAYWVKIGRRWSKAFDEGKSFPEFMRENPDIEFCDKHVIYNLKKLGYKIRRKRREFIRKRYKK